MKYTLNIFERVDLSNLLKGHASDMGSLRVVREAREDLDITEQEQSEWTEHVSADRRCNRFPESCPHCVREFAFPKSLVKLIGIKLRAMNDAKQLTVGLYGLVEKFVPELVEKEDDEPPAVECNGAQEAEMVKG